MNTSVSGNTPGQKQRVIETAISLLLVLGILAWCMQILSPFISITLWAAIIAVAIHKPFNKLSDMLGGRRKTAALVVALLGILLVIVPMWAMTTSTLDTVSVLKDKVEAGTLSVPPPRDAVKEWPVIGKKTYEQWSAASENMTGFMQENSNQLREIGSKVLGKIAGVGLGALQFLISILIAIAFLVSADKVSHGMQLLFNRLAGEKEGEALRKLSVATIRSVAVGVLGIAAIQALLGGAGMMIVGVPGAGIWALLVLVVAIAQLPPWLVLGPVIVYVFSVESTTTATLFAIWSIAVSFADMVLKPMFLGRGVDAPMLVILLGAIGGMIVSGIIGLFVGAVVLAFGYMLMMIWLKTGESNHSLSDTIASESDTQAGD